MDSGTRDGTPADELARLSNSGTEENPTSAQPAPTPRAEQAAGASLGGGGGAANPGPLARGGGAGGDLLGGIMDPTNGQWGANLNPFTGIGSGSQSVRRRFGSGSGDVPDASGSGTDNNGVGVAMFGGDGTRRD